MLVHILVAVATFGVHVGLDCADTLPVCRRSGPQLSTGETLSEGVSYPLPTLIGVEK